MAATPSGATPVHLTVAFGASDHQAAVLEHPQVLGDRRSADRQRVRQPAHRLRSAQETLEDRTPHRIAERLQRSCPRIRGQSKLVGAILIDIRPVEQRQRDGDLPGAIMVDRNVLEWRLDPTSPHRLPIATGADVRLIIVCDEGYSSSLAAATLQELGLRFATDLVGGFEAWRSRQP
jgi:rhodanese-related sulfurtransferase